MENVAKPAVEDLLVRIWGMNAKGKAFSQNAYARNLASDGALLSGVDHPLTPGDTIGIQNQDKKARFRVVTSRDAGLPHRIQVEVQLVTGQKCPWEAQIPTKPVTRGILTPRINSKRRFERLRVPFPIEIRDDRGGPAMQTAASDISGRGCYVESQAPLPLGTPLTIIFWIDSEKIVTPAGFAPAIPASAWESNSLASRLKIKDVCNRLLKRRSWVAGAFSFFGY